jgi:hypothetical protein
MKGFFWFAILGFVLAAGGIVWYSLRKFRERQFAEAARAASFLAATAGKARLVEAAPALASSAPAAAGDGVPQQKLLFEAAHKAGEAGEPALAIQLYARLLARYPASAFAVQARAAVEAQKHKLAKA